MNPIKILPSKARARASLPALAALLLAGCVSSTPFHFYTLVGPAQTGTASSRAPILIEVMPASVPQQVQRPQLVLTSDTGQITILEQQRWSQPVSEEISQALSHDLSRSLPAIDVYRSPHADQPVYRITLDVQRFEAIPNRATTLDAVWSVTRSPRGYTLTCRSQLGVPVSAASGTDYQAIVDAQRAALQQLSDQIGGAIGWLGKQPVPPSGAKAADGAAPTLPCPLNS